MKRRGGMRRRRILGPSTAVGWVVGGRFVNFAGSVCLTCESYVGHGRTHRGLRVEGGALRQVRRSRSSRRRSTRVEQVPGSRSEAGPRFGDVKRPKALMTR